jgi:hypothetical protein
VSTQEATAATIDDDAADAAPVPVELLPVTVKVYVVPVVKPVTVNGEEAPVAVNAPGLDVTVYPVGAPPVIAAVNATVAPASTLDTEVTVGASGISAIGVLPAWVTIYLAPVKPALFALLIAIVITLF